MGAKSRLLTPVETVGMRATRLAVVAKAIVTVGVGIVQYFSAAVVDRGPWLTFWEFEPRWVGLMLMLWGTSELMGQDALRSRLRREWWYFTASSAAAIPVSFAASRASALHYPNLFLLVGSAGLVSLVFLSVFRSEFSVQPTVSARTWRQ